MTKLERLQKRIELLERLVFENTALLKRSAPPTVQGEIDMNVKVYEMLRDGVMEQ